MSVTYTNAGYKLCIDKIVESNKVYNKYSQTISDQVIVDLSTNKTLSTALTELSTAVGGLNTFPSTTGNSGKFLSNDDNGNMIWSDVDAFPSQSGNAGKFLKTNGSQTSWSDTLKATSSTVPVGIGAIASIGSSTEAARADHVHPLNIDYKQYKLDPSDGDTEFLLNETFFNSDTYIGISVYRSGLLQTEGVDYSFDIDTRKLKFLGSPCMADEAIVVLGGRFLSGGLANISDVVLSDSGDLPVIDGDASIGASTHAARADHVHPKDDTKADIDSPNFTGEPTAPTVVSTTDNSNKIATTAYVYKMVTSGYLPTFEAGKYLTTNGTILKWSNPLPSYDTSTKGKVLGVNNNTTVTWMDIPTELPSTTDATANQVLALNDSKTYVWKDVLPSISNNSDKYLYTDGSTMSWKTINNVSLNNTVDSLEDGITSKGTSEYASRADHVHPSDTKKANIDSPVFTGTPKSTNPTLGDSSTRIATTKFVSDSIDNIQMSSYVGINSNTMYPLKNIVECVQYITFPDYVQDTTQEEVTSIEYTQTLNFSNGNVIDIQSNHENSLVDDLTFTFTISDSTINTYCRSITLVLHNFEDIAITWPSSVKWHNSTAPSITETNCIINFLTFDNGTTYYGSLFGNFA